MIFINEEWILFIVVAGYTFLDAPLSCAFPNHLLHSPKLFSVSIPRLLLVRELQSQDLWISLKDFYAALPVLKVVYIQQLNYNIKGNKSI